MSKYFRSTRKQEQRTLKKTQIKALHDSGCAATIINKKFFEQIPDYQKFKVNATPNTFVVSVTGDFSYLWLRNNFCHFQKCK
jgi:hypothetical protein